MGGRVRREGLSREGGRPWVSLPDVDRGVVHWNLAVRIGDDPIEPLEIFERWLREESAQGFALSELCFAVASRYGTPLSLARSPRPSSQPIAR